VETDQPIAALLKDLKQRGLLDSTLVVWMGEFGRTPDCPADLRKTAGRDHNTRAMTVWFAGGGAKAGTLTGATDDLGHKAVQDIYRMRDVHATILHLMGLEDMRLTYYHAGRNMRLTDTGGKVITQVV
jgi:arylsulfatase A-like enzyme